MDALSPNTSALLSYLSATNDSSFSFDEYPAPAENKIATNNPTSLPPSAFFNMQISGRDTPELTPESSKNSSESPDGLRAVMATDSEEDGMAVKTIGGRKMSDAGALHKRKAGHGHTVQEEHEDEDEDSGSDDPLGHEDKRAHGNDKASGGTGAGSGRRGGRKSAGGEGGTKEVSKAAKRKEQNRKAQTAFRERREAKVKDLEDKINALESKSFGAQVENENLKGILKRLQEENVALKQAAFTFAMPVSGNATPISSIPPRKASQAKPPTPPIPAEESLRSIHDIPNLAHRSSSGGMVDSPESLVSLSSGSGSSANPSIDNAEMFNAFAMGVRPEWSRDLPRNQAITAAALGTGQQNQVSPIGLTASPDAVDPFAAFTRSSSGSTSLSPLSPGSTKELDALWASFYPNGVSSNPAQSIPQKSTSAPTPSYPTPAFPTAANNLVMPGQSNTYVPPNNPVSWSVPQDRMAFRDPSTSFPPAQSAAPTTNDWSNLNDDSINDFLASLTGSNNDDQPTEPLYDFEQSDDFNSQLQKLLDQSGGNVSPSAAFNLSPNTFSTDAYLNFSPSPIASGSGSGMGSNEPSPNQYNHLNRQTSDSASSLSNSASPDSMISHPSSVSTAASSVQPQSNGQQVLQAAKTAEMTKPGDIVHVIGPDGNRLKPSELWVLMGMQHNKNVDALSIDDLCDQMKSKATCTDGGYSIGLSDAEMLFKSRTCKRN